MVVLIIQIKASEAVRTYDSSNTINLTVKQERNVHIVSTIPASYAPPFIETHLRIAETDWYTFGAVLLVNIPTPEQPLLEIKVQNNKALAHGIIIRVSTHDSILRSHWLHFSPGSIDRDNCRIRINLSRIADQQLDIENRLRAQQLLIETDIRIRDERIRLANATRISNVQRADTPIPIRLPPSANNRRNPFILDTNPENSDSS